MKRADATRAYLFCLDDMRLDALLPAAHGDMLALPDRPIVADRHQPQQVSRNHQALIGGLAIFAEPRPDVHRVAEIGELTLGVAAFADDYRAGVHAGPEGWRNAELGLIVPREAGDLALDGEETATQRALRAGSREIGQLTMTSSPT